MPSFPPQRDITRFRNQLMKLARRLRREAQSDDHSWARLLMLGAIDRAGEDATPSHLAETENMRSSNLAAILRDLEADGLIVRIPDTKDRRKVYVRLTPTGQDVLYDNRAQRERWLADAVKHALTEAEREQLEDIGELLDRIASYSPEKAGSA
jgi:DNA-binding MarR family transcriptional regulator